MKHNVRLTRGLTAVLMAAAFLGYGCDTDELLEVDVPGRVPADALADRELAETLVRSVIGDLECAWDNYVGGAAVHSDEYWPTTGNLLMRNWGQRRIAADDANLAQGACEDWGYGFYTPLQTARFQAEDVYERLSGFTDAEVPNRAVLQATVRAYGAYALVAFGEGFCSAAFDGGAELQPAEVLTLAETRFSEAISLAEQTGSQDILHLALVGRARVRLDLEDFDGAIADAERIPPGYRKVVSRDASDPRRYNTHDEYVNSARNKQATIAPAYRALEWKGVADPRVQVSTRNEVGADGLEIHYFHQKTTGRESPVTLASYAEAQLFIAEAAARTGDLDRARAVLNARHALAGIPGVEVADAPSMDAMIRLVIEERRRELFAEGGHRLNDHIRFSGTPYEVPFKGQPGSYHPDGLDHLGLPYGETTCFPLPFVERQGNPNVN